MIGAEVDMGAEECAGVRLEEPGNALVPPMCAPA